MTERVRRIGHRIDAVVLHVIVEAQRIGFAQQPTGAVGLEAGSVAQRIDSTQQIPGEPVLESRHLVERRRDRCEFTAGRIACSASTSFSGFVLVSSVPRVAS